MVMADQSHKSSDEVIHGLRIFSVAQRGRRFDNLIQVFTIVKNFSVMKCKELFNIDSGEGATGNR